MTIRQKRLIRVQIPATPLLYFPVNLHVFLQFYRVAGLKRSFIVCNPTFYILVKFKFS